MQSTITVAPMFGDYHGWEDVMVMWPDDTTEVLCFVQRDHDPDGDYDGQPEDGDIVLDDLSLMSIIHWLKDFAREMGMGDCYIAVNPIR